MAKRGDVLKFNPGDWIKDTRSLSLEERGAWFEFLLIMHQSERPGRLELAGKPYPLEPLSTAIGAVPARTREILDKLLALGVASMDPQTGAIFCRRMVREANRAADRQTAAAPRAAGHAVPPALIGLHLFASDWKLCSRWDGLLDSWKKAFPLVDFAGELRKAHAWSMTKRLPRDAAKFLYNWFSSEQDRRHARVGATIRETTQPNRPSKRNDCKMCINGSGMYYVTMKHPRTGEPMQALDPCPACNPAAKAEASR